MEKNCGKVSRITARSTTQPTIPFLSMILKAVKYWMLMKEFLTSMATRPMKEINANVTVLLSSGYSIDGQATEIMERGCDGFIQKPFNMKQLSHKVLEVLYKDG